MTDAKSALEYLRTVAVEETAGGGLESLESMPSVAPEQLMPTCELSEEKRVLAERTVEKIANAEPLDEDEGFALEAIIIPDKRPAINILEDNEFSTDHALWAHLNSGAAHDLIKKSIPPVGRVELPGHPSLPYGGTGFLVGPGLLMTNRHVAEIFSLGTGLRNLIFRSGLSAKIDLEQRFDGGSFLLDVTKVLMIHPYWDMALLAVEGDLGGIECLKLATEAPAGIPEVAVIGYPAFDPRNNTAVQDEVFGGVYNVKRLMPGKLTGRREIRSFGKRVNASTHDSSTLGGASGSAAVELSDGSVVALHFGGRYLDTNFGVPAQALAQDGRVIDAGVRFSGNPERQDGPWDNWWSQSESIQASAAMPGSAAGTAQPAASGRTSVTIPINVTIDVGGPSLTSSTTSRANQPSNIMPAPASGGDDFDPTEAPIESYFDREGYLPDFLGEDVPLPEVTTKSADILEFELDGSTEKELKYEHFSVLMSKRRRLCFFSAVNIDGGQSRKVKRVGWRWDPRIPKEQQIRYECYGNPPKFSRGHMTRREDPVWGDVETAKRGNTDSMHVTNATPQMQSFNSPIWLALEDYALDHAREDDMKISVFTGPYYDDDNDPVLYGVKVPVAFWKIIAFIHDETGELCATGYEMDQQQHLPSSAEEFVFGDFQSPQLGITVQKSIRKIEERSGISFGNLVDVDPLSSVTESFGGEMGYRLDQIEQIKFLG